MEVSDFLLTKCVWGMGMLQVVFNIEVGNYYSKSTFIMTLNKTRETFVHIGYSLHQICIQRFLISGIRFTK